MAEEQALGRKQDSVEVEAATPSARARFEGLGTLLGGVTASWASDVSANGDVIAGWSVGRQGDEAFRWTRETGMRSLGAEGGVSRAYAISSDGLLIVGSATPLQGADGAAVWREGSLLELLDDPPERPSGFAMTSAHAVTDDGRVYGTCVQAQDPTAFVGCRWSAAHGVQRVLGSHIYGVDALGNVVGTMLLPSSGSFALRNGARLPFAAACSAAEQCQAEARALNGAGDMVVGTSLLPDPSAPSERVATAFIHARGEGTTALEVSAMEDYQGSGAYDISANGDIIVGYVRAAEQSHAAVWIDRIPYLLTDLLSSELDGALAGWRLHELRAVSADGRTVVGNGLNPSGRSEAFRAALTTP